MLHEIRIRNLALIRGLEIEFGRGLNLLTGETGSGKSILVDALGLLLGARSSQEMIRSDCDSAVVEGLFEIEHNGSIAKALAEAGFEGEENSLLIRREIASSGKNRIFINNNLGTLSFLKSIGESLADIHGQQDQRSLLDLSTHLDWLDDFGSNETLRQEVEETYDRFQETVRQIRALQNDEQERLRRSDILRYQIEEIQNVNPGADEKEALENERNLLAHREKILALATEAYGILYDSESSILRQANRLERILEELEQFDRAWAAHREALQESKYRMEDLSYIARDYASRTDFSPERLEQVHQRLHAIEKLIKKYGASCREILQFRDACAKELEQIVSYAECSEKLAAQFQGELIQYEQSAKKLSMKRRKDAKRLEMEIEKEFKALAMEPMKIEVQFKQVEAPLKDELYPSRYGRSGIDNVEFLIAPNRGEEFKPLAKIASGGELSRLMLSIKSLCRNDEADRTFVFDEVDAGIGGRVAEAVGKRLRNLSKDHQVLCVTHLPQIAAFANRHFSVQKGVIGERTETFVKLLNDRERVQELSRMLGGETITQTVREHAQEMLEYSLEVRKKV